MNSATEELRRLLDERGVRWYTGEIIHKSKNEVTAWLVDGYAVRADEHKDGRLVIEMNLTPAQTIAATRAIEHPRK